MPLVFGFESLENLWQSKSSSSRCPFGKATPDIAKSPVENCRPLSTHATTPNLPPPAARHTAAATRRIAAAPRCVFVWSSSSLILLTSVVIGYGIVGCWVPILEIEVWKLGIHLVQFLKYLNFSHLDQRITAFHSLNKRRIFACIYIFFRYMYLQDKFEDLDMLW